MDSGDIVWLTEWNGWVGNNPRVTCRTWTVISFDQVTNVLQVRHWYYDFQIRTSPSINFVDEAGNVVDTFDAEDAQYSLWRGLVQDQIGSPQWMLYKPLTNLLNSEEVIDPPNNVVFNPDGFVDLAYQIKDAIEIFPGPTLRINIGIAFSDAAFKQILCQTWGAIVSKEFSVSIGCWNGDLTTDGNGDGYPDWWDGYGYYIVPRRTSRSPYDAVWNYRYVGTGPYRVLLWDSVNYKVIMERNTLYWNGWPCTDRKAYLDRIETDYITDWAPRRDAFIASQYDVCAVPRAYMGELLDAYGEPKYPEIKTIKKISPVLATDAMLYTFTIDAASPYIGTGSLPDGIPTDFFNNTHVRKAFSYGFNRTKYLSEAWNGEATSRDTPGQYGLVPDYYTYSPDPPWVYDINFSKARKPTNN